MTQNTLQAGNPARRIASVPQGDSKGENTHAIIAQGSVHPWVLHFVSVIGGRKCLVGSVRTFPTSKEAHLVAIVSIPGAVSVEVWGQCSVPSVKDEMSIDIEGIEAKGGPWGVFPIPGASVAGGRSYRVITGVAGGPIVVTGTVLGWTATSTAGGTVTATALPSLTIGPIVIPPGSTISGDARGLLSPVSNWTFVGTDSYAIEFVPPDGQFDG